REAQRVRGRVGRKRHREKPQHQDPPLLQPDRDVYVLRRREADGELRKSVLSRHKRSAIGADRAANRTANGGEDEGEAMKMAEDFGKGAVEFNLRMAAWTTFRSDSWWTRRSTVRVFCEELKVGFSGKSGNGSLVAGGNRDCLVLVLVCIFYF
ncbi:hypothetical protein LINPERHAP1_LOCUS26767, partial [Linum perenne]